MGYINAWKRIIENGGLLTANEAATLLAGEDNNIYQTRPALNKTLYLNEINRSYTYAEILGMIDDVIIKLQNGIEIGILDLIKSDVVGKRTFRLPVVLADILYREKWLG